MKRSLVLLALLSGCGSGESGSKSDSEARDPGRVTLHRLNRVEYNNTVRDLLGTTLTPADDFPLDDFGYGFDNIASTLSISPLHVEMYERAAEALADDAFRLGNVERQRFMFEAEEAVGTTGAPSGGAYNLWSNGTLSDIVDIPLDGEYRITVRAWGQQAGPDNVEMSIGVDGVTYDTVTVAAASEASAQTFDVVVPLSEGPHELQVSFLNDYYDPDLGADRNLLVDWMEAYGPVDDQSQPNPIRDRLVTCDPTELGERACIEQVLAPLAYRAYRRPVSEAELAELMTTVDAILDDGGTFDDGLKIGLKRLLLSPHFLYRVELDDNPTSADPHRLSDYELASRLSYFLWSTMPDDELMSLASTLQLRKADVLEAQVDRMLADPRSQALVDNFAGQWLYIRAVDDKTPDLVIYPEFDESLRDAMKEETRRLFASMLENDRDMREMLTTTTTEVNDRLAEHYGMPAPAQEWGSVDLSGTDRAGILGHAGLLTVTSYPARTSPVQRGAWVLGNLLCDEPPPPPPSVEGLPEDDAADPQTVRERLEQHAKDPVCASCHLAMDPIGFGLEHFDGIGAFREIDNGNPVDASGELPDGTTFYGGTELASILASDPRYPHCIAEKMFIYAHGRGTTEADEPFLDEMTDRLVEEDYRLRGLIKAMVTSDTFTHRRGQTAEEDSQIEGGEE